MEPGPGLSTGVWQMNKTATMDYSAKMLRTWASVCFPDLPFTVWLQANAEPLGSSCAQWLEKSCLKQTKIRNREPLLGHDID